MKQRFTSNFANESGAIGRRGFLLAGVGVIALGVGSQFWPVTAQSTAPKGYDIMDAQSAYDAAKAGEIILVDIRRPDEWETTGIAEGAVALDMREEGFVNSLVQLRQIYPDRPIALICRTGNRTNHVVSTLAAQNFPGLVDVSEGMVGGRNGQGWLSRGLPIYAGQQGEITRRLNAVMSQ